MSIKLHYLRNHLDKFLDNLGNYSEEQGERFHQDLKVMEERYQAESRPAPRRVRVTGVLTYGAAGVAKILFACRCKSNKQVILLDSELIFGSVETVEAIKHAYLAIDHISHIYIPIKAGGARRRPGRNRLWAAGRGRPPGPPGPPGLRRLLITKPLRVCRLTHTSLCARASLRRRLSL
ncbi:hypothetical protein EVAR_6281_1 [Eumeta japonica]|uniref:Uncharacterized protein n=1 Tax=Eumeta variegata TaxID=151549 RepID=A0A4C1T8A4_EUMVA|nr:hypothetical protein EVAR_6281_1 [Eumeta japonica]